MAEIRAYTCEGCGGTFESDHNEEELKAEAEALFPNIDIDDQERSGQVSEVCDDCYKVFVAWLASLTPAERAQLDEGARRDAAAVAQA